MNEKEVIRRLRAIVALPRESRPIPLSRLEQLAGLSDGELYTIEKRGTLSERTRIRLAKALSWVENDQVVVKKTPNRPTVISIVEPKPPCEIEPHVHISTEGVRIRYRALNPRTFPKFKG